MAFSLTHRGRPIDSLARCDPVASDDEDGLLDDYLVKDVHFSGGMFSSRKDGEKAMSFKEKMSDIINRSKAMKAERQLHQEEIKNIVNRLDDNWQMTIQKMSTEPLITRGKASKEKKQAATKRSLVDMNSLVYGLQNNTEAMTTSSGGLRQPSKTVASHDRALERLQYRLEKDQDSPEDTLEPEAKRRKITESKNRTNDSFREKKLKLTFLEILHGLKVLTKMDSNIRCQTIATIADNLHKKITHFGNFVATLLMANLLSSTTTDQSRFSPELHRFLCDSIQLAVPPKERISDITMPLEKTPSFLNISTDFSHVDSFEINVTESIDVLESAMIKGVTLSPPQLMSLRIHSLVLIFILLKKEFEAASKRNNLWMEILEPYAKRLELLPAHCYPPALNNLLQELKTNLTDALEAGRSRTVLKWKAPPRKEVEMIDPIFGDDLVVQKRASSGRKRPSAWTAAERTKALKKRVKNEAKALMQKLRRDTEFSRVVKRRSEERKDRTRKKKVSQILGDLAMQEGDFRKLSHRK